MYKHVTLFDTGIYNIRCLNTLKFSTYYVCINMIHHVVQFFILGCLKDIEFQCNASVCIDMIRRCDTKQDCVDGKDEEGCGKYNTQSP